MESEKKVITIKRYSNRKLYDTSRSCYVTLIELGEMIREGANIAVIDNDTKADLTDVTLTQILMVQQKQKQKGIRNLVQNQAEILLQRLSVPVQQIRDEALRQVEKQIDKFRHKSEGVQTQEPSGETDAQTPVEETVAETQGEHSTSLDLKLEALKSSSDEKLIAYVVLQRLEELETEVADLRRRVALLERKDDEMY